MKKKLFLILGVLLVMGALVVSYSLSTAKQAVVINTIITPYTETPVPFGITPPVNEWSGSVDARISTPESIFKEGLPNTAEAQEIIQTIQKSREIEMEASRTYDLSKFPTVFINDPRFDLPAKWLKVVRKATHNPTLEKAGYLEFRIASYSLTREEFLANEAHRLLQPPYTPEPTPTVPPGVTLVLVGPPPPLTFISMDIKDNIATVVVNEGAVTREMILVLVNGQWYIASGNIISIHP